MTSSPADTGSRIDPMALSGFVVSLVSVLIVITTWPATILALVGLVLSIVGRRRTARGGVRGGGFALAGIVLGIVGLVLSVGYYILVVTVLIPQFGQLRP